MKWLRVAGVIDRLSDRIGRVTSWLALIMVLVGAFNAIFRYLGRFLGVQLGSNSWLELQWYLFSLLFLLGAAYALRYDAHVRVDVLFARLSDRARAWINIAGTVLLLLPFTIFMLIVSWPTVRNSWGIREVSSDPGGLPRYPLKTFLLVCFALLFLQGISELIKEIHALRTGTPAEHDLPHPPTEGV